MDFHVNWPALLFGMAVGSVVLAVVLAALTTLIRTHRTLKTLARMQGGVGPITPAEALRESIAELAEGQRRIARVVAEHVEETDPTFITGVGKVLLPEPMYSEFLERASGYPATPATRLAYQEWCTRNVPSYEQWMVKFYPILRGADEAASALATGLQDPVPGRDGSSSTPQSEPSEPHTVRTESSKPPGR